MYVRETSPKLLLEFYRGEKVPALVRKDEQFAANRFRNSSSPSAHSSHSKKTIQPHRYVNAEISDLREQNERLKSENLDLRSIIEQLSRKSQELKQINQELLVRVGDMQNRYNSLIEMAENERKSNERRIKREVYQDLEMYLKNSVENFTQGLSKQKMSPLVEKKIEEFLESLLNINSLSVKQYLKSSNGRNLRESKITSNEIDETIKQIVERQNRSNQRSQNSSSKQYRTIFEQLNRKDSNQKRSNYSFTNVKEGAKDNMNYNMNNEAGKGSPYRSAKRTKIFNRNYVTDTKHQRASRQLQY